VVVESSSWGKLDVDASVTSPRTGGIHHIFGDAPLETPLLTGQ